MKNYYQQKKGGCSLEPVIYAKTVKQIRCYRFFQKKIQEHEAADSQGCEGMDLQELETAQNYIRAIEQGLKQYVPAAYREAVFAHMVDGVEYIVLEEKFFVSKSTLKRYAQAFVWGVAEQLGECFSAGSHRNDEKTEDRRDAARRSKKYEVTETLFPENLPEYRRQDYISAALVYVREQSVLLDLK